MKNLNNDELSIIAEIARMYYVEGYSQKEISNILFLSKPKVSRAIKKAREEKIIQFIINYPITRSNIYETKLKEKFCLDDAIVVNNLDDYNNVRDISIKRIGEVAADYLDKKLEDGDAVGISWGKTIAKLVHYLSPSSNRKIQVFQLVGSPVKDYMTTYQIATMVQNMAEVFGGDYKLLYAPLYIENDIVRRELIKEPIIKSILKRIPTIDYVVTGIGDMSIKPNNTWAGYLTTDKKKELVEKGAIGYICGYFIDKNGNKVDDEINKKIIGIDFDYLKSGPYTIVVAGGADKSLSIYAALLGGLVDCLITDSDIAKKLMELDNKGE